MTYGNLEPSFGPLGDIIDGHAAHRREADPFGTAPDVKAFDDQEKKIVESRNTVGRYLSSRALHAPVYEATPRRGRHVAESKDR